MEDLDLMMKVIVVGDGRKKHFIKDIGEEVEFYIWDTAGQEEFNSLTRRYYKGASACILAFSTTDRDSFDHVEKWKNAVEDECGDIPMIMVQTKIDLIDNAVMTEKEVNQLAKKLQMPLMRICSKDNIMITELFEFLAIKFFSKDMHKQEGHAPIQSIQDIKQQSISTSLASWNNQSANGSGGGQNRSQGHNRSQTSNASARDGSVLNALFCDNLNLVCQFSILLIYLMEKTNSNKLNNPNKPLKADSVLNEDKHLIDYTPEHVDELDLQNMHINLLFFLKKVEDENIIESLVRGVEYILDKQIEQKCKVVSKIYLEQWVIKKLPQKLFNQSMIQLEVWELDYFTGEVLSDVELDQQRRFSDQINREVHFDYIITIGGDGTILRLLQQIREYEKYRNLPPIITFSMNNVEELEIKTVIQKGNQPSTQNNPTTNQNEIQLLALNEITIMRNQENMLQVEVYINNVLLTVVQATPTGSTAYNLSCGGPIVHQNAQILCLTPIAPHSLSFRPVILPANEEVKIKIPDSSRTSAKVTIDGHTKIDLNPEDFILIRKSNQDIPCNNKIIFK
ncbi:small rab-related gtpase [Stylonychia lemnae]|uniref:Small rab-related gtpase n=1 Tax=Stylonychia lemnae TaxID=5949 RepID=A0A078AFL9_STYLE|nr:small rab-related gtpase [Stylonychia lemnae]|eukprot:CDW80302.1 small rab-related gtpase [Stylonychia lemnae]